LLPALLLPSAHAADGASSRPADGPQASASSLLMAQLQKMQSSAQRLNYSGSFVYQYAALMRSSRLTHVVAGKSVLKKLELLDGQPAEFIRSNDEVASYLPQSQVTPPPGFRRIQQVRRLMAGGAPEGAAPAQNRPAGREVSQMVFSDGLAAIPVFIEPDSQGREEGSALQGAMHILGRPLGDYWLTVMGGSAGGCDPASS